MSVQEGSFAKNVVGLQTALKKETIKKSQLDQDWEDESGRGRNVGQMGLPGSVWKSGSSTKPSFPSAGRNPEMM